MNELRLVVFENMELQHQGNSILIALFGIPSMWGSQNDKFRKNFFRSKGMFFDPGETTIVKEKLKPKSGKKNNF